MSVHDPRSRISYTGELGPVFERAAHAYRLGDFQSYEVVPVGYEDFNAALRTTEGKFFAKVFFSDRTDPEIDRWEAMMHAVIDGRVSHPHLYSAHGEFVYNDQKSDLSMAAMDFIEGETFFDLKRTPTSEELVLILRQAVLVNDIDHKPDYLPDSWAIPNIKETYAPIKDKIQVEDSELIEKALAELDGVNINKLPHCFVHGDFTKSNILLGNDGEVYILDFSVSNWYPRIQELAVIVGNLLNSTEESESFYDVLKKVVRGYVEQGGKLTDREMDALPAYCRAAYASELIGGSRELIINRNDTEETSYWIELGRAGLRRAYSH